MIDVFIKIEALDYKDSAVITNINAEIPGKSRINISVSLDGQEHRTVSEKFYKDYFKIRACMIKDALNLEEALKEFSDFMRSQIIDRFVVWTPNHKQQDWRILENTLKQYDLNLHWLIYLNKFPKYYHGCKTIRTYIQCVNEYKQSSHL